jgi:hypothetical protein
MTQGVNTSIFRMFVVGVCAAIVAVALAADYSDQENPVSLQSVYDQSTSYTNTKAPAGMLYERFSSQYNCPVTGREPSRVCSPCLASDHLLNSSCRHRL